MTRGGFTRWLYRGQRPHWIAKIENKASAVLFSWGMLPDYLVTLQVTGRTSGRTISLPLVIAVIDGERYVVSMLGEHAQWVQNVRATHGEAVLCHGGCKQVHLEEVAAQRRAPILKAYLQRAPGARPHLPVSKDAPLEEFEKIAAAFPVFRVTSGKTMEC